MIAIYVHDGQDQIIIDALFAYKIKLKKEGKKKEAEEVEELLELIDDEATFKN